MKSSAKRRAPKEIAVLESGTARVRRTARTLRRLGPRMGADLHRLEARRLLADAVNLPEIPDELTPMGDAVYFAMDDGIHGAELWRSDGTPAGTKLVKDINAGRAASAPRSLAVFSGMLYFAADDGIHGDEIWRSDGTAGGTALIADIRDGPDGSSPDQLTGGENCLFFSADDGATGSELWKTDGTSSGTKRLLDISPGATGSSPANFTSVDSQVFFTATDRQHGSELWQSDGTAAGTSLVKDIHRGPIGSLAHGNLERASVLGTLFFVADDGLHGAELWRTDGTAAGTVLVADVLVGAGSSAPSSLTGVDGLLFFTASDGVHGNELWRSAGTAASTALVKDIDGGARSSLLPDIELTSVNAVIFFAADDGTGDQELWRSDGTADGTFRLKDLDPHSSSSPRHLTATDGLLYFAADDGSGRNVLWRSDGTASATEMVGHTNPVSFVESNGVLFGVSALSQNSAALWRIVDPVVRVSGTAAADLITVSISGAKLRIDRDGEVLRTVSPGDVTRVEVRALDGADVVDCSTIAIPMFIDAGDGNDRVIGGAGSDTVIGGAGNDSVLGEEGADFISGGDGADTLRGGAGKDVIAGGAGPDLLAGGGANDRLGGENGRDRLYGGGGNDHLFGGRGDDRLLGHYGTDQLFGGSGDDRLDGGYDADLCVGGGGRDTVSANHDDTCLGSEQVLDADTAASNMVLAWQTIAGDVLRSDTTRAGPGWSSRNLAITSIAVFDAVNAIDGQYQSYLTGPAGYHASDTSMPAAVASAAHDALSELYPKQASMIDAALRWSLSCLPAGAAQIRGVELGRTTADEILSARAGDGAEHVARYVLNASAGHWQPDPLNPSQTAWGPGWGQMAPFSLTAGNQFRAPPPPSLESKEYAAAFEEVKTLGAKESLSRTAEQTQIGLFWGYDRSGMGTPPLLYCQAISSVCRKMRLSLGDSARLFALANIAQADAGIAAWDTKYAYDFWRPIIAIRRAGEDRNSATVADANWEPLGAPGGDVVNDFTPPFPAYTSGHATFGAAAFRVLANFFGTDQISFTLTSDELPGVQREFNTLSQAAAENARSRIYLGIHWSFDDAAGQAMGRQVADWACAHALQPLRPDGER